MPCNTISTVTVDAGKMQLDLVADAMRAMGLTNVQVNGQIVTHWNGTYNRQTGQATWRGQDRTAELKRHYSREVVLGQAKRYGWQVKQSASNPWQYEVTRR